MAFEISNGRFEFIDHLGYSFYINHCYGCEGGCPSGSDHYVGRIDAFNLLCKIFSKHRIIRKCNYYKKCICEYNTRCLNLHIKHDYRIRLGRTIMRIVEHTIDGKLDNYKVLSDEFYYNTYDCHITSGLINLITYIKFELKHQLYKQQEHCSVAKEQCAFDVQHDGDYVDVHSKKRKFKDYDEYDEYDKDDYDDASKFLVQIKKEIEFVKVSSIKPNLFQQNMSLNVLETKKELIMKQIEDIDIDNEIVKKSSISYLALEILMYYAPLDKIDIILKEKNKFEKYNSTFEDIKDEKIKQIVANRILSSL